MFFEGWGSPGGPKIGPKIDFSGSVAPFSDTFVYGCFKVVFKSAFFENKEFQAE